MDLVLENKTIGIKELMDYQKTIHSVLQTCTSIDPPIFNLCFKYVRIVPAFPLHFNRLYYNPSKTDCIVAFKTSFLELLSLVNWNKVHLEHVYILEPDKITPLDSDFLNSLIRLLIPKAKELKELNLIKLDFDENTSVFMSELLSEACNLNKLSLESYKGTSQFLPEVIQPLLKLKKLTEVDFVKTEINDKDFDYINILLDRNYNLNHINFIKSRNTGISKYLALFQRLHESGKPLTGLERFKKEQITTTLIVKILIFTIQTADSPFYFHINKKNLSQLTLFFNESKQLTADFLEILPETILTYFDYLKLSLPLVFDLTERLNNTEIPVIVLLMQACFKVGNNEAAKFFLKAEVDLLKEDADGNYLAQRFFSEKELIWYQKLIIEKLANEANTSNLLLPSHLDLKEPGIGDQENNINKKPYEKLNNTINGIKTNLSELFSKPGYQKANDFNASLSNLHPKF